MAPHSSTLAWKILWKEEPGGLQSMGLRRVRHYWLGKNAGVGCLCPLPGGLPHPGIQPASPFSLALQADSLALSHLGSPKAKLWLQQKLFLEGNHSIIHSSNIYWAEYIIIAGCLYFVLDLPHSTMSPWGLRPRSFSVQTARSQQCLAQKNWLHFMKTTVYWETECVCI